MRSVIFVVTCLVFASMNAHAQTSEGLSGLLEQLIPQDRLAPLASELAQERRVPFSNGEVQLSFAPLVAQVSPAVVNIYAARRVQQRSPFAGDPFFDQFFGRQFSGPPRLQSSLGSGVIVASDGLVVTNHHVIANAQEIRVALADGREFESELILSDERLDLAVLRMRTGDRFSTVAFGDSDALLTGDLVLAIGNPFGVGQTITSGIVSAIARNGVGVSDFGFFIQTDAAINPGNSGGALVDMSGNLIGINTAIYTRSGGSNGIGFAIPANIVRAVVEQAERGLSDFERPYVGAAFTQVTPAIAKSLGMRRPFGALIENVFDQSPAQDAGLRPGDVVIGVNGQQIEHPDALGYRLATIGPGKMARFELLSRGRERSVDIMLGSPRDAPRPAIIAIDGDGPFSGIELGELTPQLARDLRLSSDSQGFAVLRIARGSPALRAGMRPGDIIIAVNGTALQSLDQAKELLSSDARSWRLTLERNGRIVRQFLRF